jgi:hypothetical protein
MKIKIDGFLYAVTDPVINGRQILELLGKRPGDFIVYHLNTQLILDDLSLDETIDIRHGGVDEFLTFESDRSFRFEIDGKREDWGANFITAATVRKLGNLRADQELWLEQKDRPDRLISADERIDLGGPGIEKFYSPNASVVTIVNEDDGQEFNLNARLADTVETTIRKVYEKLRVHRQTDDRLRCEDGGEDVFGFGQLTLKQYLTGGHCRCLVWLFAGGTGGAH